MQEAEQKLIEIYRACLSLDLKDEEILALVRKDCPKWDSMGHLNLILAAEDVFQISIPEDKGAKIGTFAEMEATVKSLKAAS